MRDARLLAYRVTGPVLTALLAAAILAAPAWAQESVPDASTTEATRVVVGTGGNGLVLRAGPGLEFPVVGLLPEGTGVQIVTGPIASQGTPWYHVQLNGAGTLSGYSSGAYLLPPGQQPSAGNASPAPTDGRVFVASVTGYAFGADGGAVGTVTASGTGTHWGTVAADTRLFPFGTRLEIEGFADTVFVVEDTGSAVRGLVIDVWFPDLETATRFGTQRRQVTVLPGAP